MTHDELIQTAEYWTTKIQIDLYNKVEEYMQAHNLNRTQLAEMLGVSKGYITQVLNGDYDHRISKLTELALSIGLVPDLHFIPVENFINGKKLTIEETRNEIFALSKAADLNVMIYNSSSDKKLRYAIRSFSGFSCPEILTA